MMAYSDAKLIALYREWSDETYAAGFYGATEHSVRRFRGWLQITEPERVNLPPLDYEQDMLDEYRKQEAGGGQLGGGG